MEGTLDILDQEPHGGPATDPKDIGFLLERIQKGDREAFMTVVRLYQQKISFFSDFCQRRREKKPYLKD